MELHEEKQSNEKKSKKTHKEAPMTVASSPVIETAETKAITVKVTFEGEAAKRILKCETELRERLSKPDMGKIIGTEVLTWTEKRWAEIIEENTDIEYFFAQIRKCADKSKSVKLLKALSEKLRSESSEGVVSSQLASLSASPSMEESQLN